MQVMVDFCALFMDVCIGRSDKVHAASVFLIPLYTRRERVVLHCLTGGTAFVEWTYAITWQCNVCCNELSHSITYLLI